MHLLKEKSDEKNIIASCFYIFHCCAVLFPADNTSASTGKWIQRVIKVMDNYLGQLVKNINRSGNCKES
jgi:hypothetical protein